jgi:hypothetical protein
MPKLQSARTVLPELYHTIAIAHSTRSPRIFQSWNPFPLALSHATRWLASSQLPPRRASSTDIANHILGQIRRKLGSLATLAFIYVKHDPLRCDRSHLGHQRPLQNHLPTGRVATRPYQNGVLVPTHVGEPTHFRHDCSTTTTTTLLGCVLLTAGAAVVVLLHIGTRCIGTTGPSPRCDANSPDSGPSRQ